MGAPAAIVSDGGSIFKAKLVLRLYEDWASSAARSTLANPGRTTSKPTSTSCGVCSITNWHVRRPGQRCGPRMTASSHDYNAAAPLRPPGAHRWQAQPRRGAGLGHGHLVRSRRTRPPVHACGRTASSIAMAISASGAGASMGSGAWPGGRARPGCSARCSRSPTKMRRLAQYQVAYEPDGRQIQAVTGARLYAHRYPSPQLILPSMDTLERQLYARLPARHRRRRPAARGIQGCLFPA